MTTVLNLAYCARKSYEQYLEVQEKLKEEEKRIAKENEKKLKEEKLCALKESFAKLENKVLLVNKEKSEIKETTDKLSEKANGRFKKALKAGGMQGIRLAQRMIEGSLQLRQKEKEHEKMSKNSIKLLTKEKKYDKFIHE